MKRETIVVLVAYLFIVLFFYTALSKWFLYSVYLHDLERSPELSSFAVPISILIPGAELLAAVMLLFDRTRRIGLWIALGLMIAFTVYVALVLMFAPELPCTCGGIIRELSWPNHLIFNIVFTVLAAVALYMGKIKRGEHQGHLSAI